MVQDVHLHALITQSKAKESSKSDQFCKREIVNPYFENSAENQELTLSGCWVDGDGVVEINLAGAHLYGDGETLDNLVGALTDDVEAHNSFFRTLHDELEGGGLFVLFLYHAEVEGLEGSFVWAQASLNTVV